METAKSVTSLFPYGTATQIEIISTIRSLCIEEDIRNLEAILSDWRGASRHFQEMVNAESGVPESISTMEIDNSYKALLDKISSNTLFKQSYSLIPIEFKLVEIEKLIAPQRLVDLDFVQRLKSMLPKNPSMQDMIGFCLDPKQDPPLPKELDIAPNLFVYSSPNTDFRFLGGYPKPLTDEDIKASTSGGVPAAAIMLLLGYGSPRCNVYSFGKRIILNNGFHRLYALLEMGIKYAPLIVQKITNPNVELEPQIAGMPIDYLLNSPRPVLMKDFFDKRLVRIIHKKPTIKEVKIGWTVQQSSVPI